MINELIEIIKSFFIKNKKINKKNLEAKEKTIASKSPIVLDKKIEALKKIHDLKRKVKNQQEEENELIKEKTNHNINGDNISIKINTSKQSDNKEKENQNTKTIIKTNLDIDKPIEIEEKKEIKNSERSLKRKKRISRQEKTINKYFEKKEQEEIFQPKKNVFKNELDKDYVSKSSLMRKIKINLFYLEELLIVFEGEAHYLKYYNKIKDMKEQSENCFKIVFRLRDDAPYLKKTLVVILEHTRVISKLLESKIN